MNERIRELAEQAKIDYELLPEIAREPVWIAIDDELEKFAQLIVQDVLNEVLQAMDDGQDVYYTVADKFRS
jgi:hypothetical protein